MNKKKLRESIYLQIGESQTGEDRTWCEDKINDTDVKYIREDVVLKREQELLGGVEETAREYYRKYPNANFHDFIGLIWGEKARLKSLED